MQVLRGPIKTVDRVRFSPNGELLAGAGDDAEALAVWDRVSARPRYVAELELEMLHWPFCFTPNGDLLIAGDDADVVALDAATGTEVWRVVPNRNATLAALDVTTDGRLLLIADYFHYNSPAGHQVWALNGRAEPSFVRGTKGTRLRTACAAAFLPGTDTFVVGEGYTRKKEGTQVLVVPAAKKPFPLLVPHKDLNSVAASPDGRFVAAQYLRVLVVWRASNFAEPPTEVIQLGRKHFTGIAFHPSGKYLAATSNDETVKLYDTATWELAHTFTWKVGRMRSIAFSPDGAIAAAGSDKGQVVVWDVDL